jgi:hypothetical protein
VSLAGGGAILCAAPAHAVLQVVNPADATDVRTIDANLDIQPNAMGNAFFQRVQDCLNELKAYPAKAQTLVDLVNSVRTHTIERTDGGSNNRTSPPLDNESNGMGTGSQTFWNPDNNALPTYADGTPRDPCAAMLHELVHAHDKDRGVMDRTPIPTTAGAAPETVILSEVRACQAQNWLHQEKGQPSRVQYGGEALPLGVQFDRCADRVCLFVGDGAISYPVVDVPHVMWEVPVAGRDPSPVMGKEVEIRDALGNLVGTAVLIKNLDGTVSVRMTTSLLADLVLTAIQFKNDGQDLGMPVDLPAPLVVTPTMPTGTSAPVAPPPVGCIGVSKGPDHTAVAMGGMITFTFVVTNKGTLPLTNVMVTDPQFPACNQVIANLAPGASQTFMCIVTVGNASFVNGVQVTAQAAGPPAQNVGPVVDTAPVTVN